VYALEYNTSRCSSVALSLHRATDNATSSIPALTSP
jgi:hypothetical protein